MRADSLALLGGPPAAISSPEDTRWPVVTDAERQAVLNVLDSGRFTSNAVGRGGEVQRLEDEFAELCGVAHCVAVANGTAALELALDVLGLDPGAEVIVPALTFFATAAAVVRRGYRPSFADIDPVTFNLDPDDAGIRCTPATQAIVAVHLHGLPADMDRLVAVAAGHGLALVEDAAQAHGASWRGRPVGSFGSVNAFSLNATKNLPTCGEGGLITTDHPTSAERLTMLRQFGERLPERGPRDFISRLSGCNEKLGAVQAAFARAQLQRFAEMAASRQENVRLLLRRLAELPGLAVPACPPDRTHAWHILRFMLDPATAGLDGIEPGAFRHTVQRVLRAEGVPVEPYQLVPLPGQRAFHDPPSAGVPRSLVTPLHEPQKVVAEFPRTADVIERSLTLQRRHLNPAAGRVMAGWADAFEKVWEHLDVVGELARAADCPAPWDTILETEERAWA